AGRDATHGLRVPLTCRVEDDHTLVRRARDHVLATVDRDHDHRGEALAAVNAAPVLENPLLVVRQAVRVAPLTTRRALLDGLAARTEAPPVTPAHLGD